MMPDDVDAQWLTRSIRATTATAAVITHFVATSIGTGQVGENVRFELEWNDDDPALPASVVGKFPSISDVSRATAVQMNTYVKEVGFYRDLRDLVTVRTPELYAFEWDVSNHDFVLLMEDVRPARAGDQLEGCDIASAELAIDQAVGLHAPTWGRPPTGSQFDWLGVGRDDDQMAMRAQLFEILTPGFVERFTPRLSPDDIALAAPLTGAFTEWFASVRSWADRHQAWCVVHGDFRLDNLLFGVPPQSPALTVVDWQTVSVGIGPNDIAYFCGAGLLPHERNVHERRLVDRYSAGLRAAGVEIADDDVWEGYVLGSATGYFMAVLASQVVERTERGDEMFAVMAERHADQIRTVGLLDRLRLG